MTPAPGGHAGHTPPAPTGQPTQPALRDEHRISVTGPDSPEGGVPAVLRFITEWEPTGDLGADLATLAALDRLRTACVAAISDHAHTVGRHHRDEHGKQKITEAPWGRVERRWKRPSARWDRTEDVFTSIVEECSLADAIRCLPERVAWRIGDPDKGTPGLKAIGIDPDEHRTLPDVSDGRWEFVFTHGGES